MTTRPAPAPGSGRLRSGTAGVPDHVDLVVVGLGITGAGVALDAATRGLSVLAVDAHDVAFGTSRWSSKLVHGGLRYLANGQLGVAHESAVERGVLMETTAPHLVHPMPMLVPLTSAVTTWQALTARVGFRAGDLLRRSAGTGVDTLPRPRHLSATEALGLAPCLRRAGLRGGLLSWDGQLEDDARLVVAVARTAAAFGAEVRTRVRAVEATGTRVLLQEADGGEPRPVTARAVVNATGVWAGQVDPTVHLRPSRGTHLVLRGESFPGLRTAITAPIPGSTSRYVLVLPQPDGLVYVGLTDEPVVGPVPDVPEPTETEIGFLLDVVGAVVQRPLHRADVVGAYAGLRPLLAPGPHAGAETADLSRRHAVLTRADGLVTVVGGKLTTYRRMAQDAVDAALAAAGAPPRPCVTASQPLVGAGPGLDRVEAPARLVRRYGVEAETVLAEAGLATGLSRQALLEPLGPTVPVTRAELAFGVTHEGARSVADLLERRTRVALVPADLPVAEDAANEVLARTAASLAS